MNWHWGKLKDHQQKCEDCSGTGYEDLETGETCESCCGSGKIRWGSFYTADTGDCEFCGAADAEIAVMYEDEEYICLTCYVQHHYEGCGCNLWKGAERYCSVGDNKHED